MLLASTGLLTAAGKARVPNKICLFEKPVQSMSYAELTNLISDLGMDGISATVRKGGHITPDKAAEELPRLAEALSKRKLEITELTTDIVAADQPHAESILRTAAKLGVSRYRTGPLKYVANTPIPEQVEAYRKQFSQLAALNKSLGIGGYYQVHSGPNNVGAPVWDIWQMVKDHPVEVLGIAWDIRHATVEGGHCWPTNFRLTRPHTGIVYAKDFVWNGRKAGNVPLGEGLVDPKFWKMLIQSGFDGPINLHVEYPLPEGRDAAVHAIRKDLQTLREWLAG